jgi:hypothetical protein
MVYTIIAGVSTVLLAGFSLFLAKSGSTYQWAFLLLAPLIWAVYFLRDKLALRPSHFALFAFALLFHDLGTFGFYRSMFLGLRFDSYVHFLFGLVAGVILYNTFQQRLGLSRRAAIIVVPIFILGLGGIHELFECFTTILLGPEKGMLKMRPDEPFDTQKDLMNNLLGAVVAVTWEFLCRARSRRKEVLEDKATVQMRELPDAG